MEDIFLKKHSLVITKYVVDIKSSEDYDIVFHLVYEIVDLQLHHLCTFKNVDNLIGNSFKFYIEIPKMLLDMLLQKDNSLSKDILENLIREKYIEEFNSYNNTDQEITEITEN